MGQDITVTRVESGVESAHIFSLNRSLTGMEIITYSDKNMTVDTNNAAEVLAQRLLEMGVETVSVYSNIVTINCEPEIFGKLEKQISETIENLFRFYGDNAGWAAGIAP